jgi:hypothetical protein
MDGMEAPRGRHVRRGLEGKEATMLFFIGAIALALVALGTSWGTIGTVVILITAMAWLALAFRPVEAGALVSNLTRRRFE